MDIKNFTGLYPLSKTLRFELKPIGKTKENIEKNGLLKQDQDRANRYPRVKKVINEYHQKFIDDSLNAFKENLSEEEYDLLKKFYQFYSLPLNDPTRNKEIIKVQKDLREKISESFTRNENYKMLFGTELIRKELTNFVKSPNYKKHIRLQKKYKDISDDKIQHLQDEIIKDIDEFKNLTTYFSDFNKNRKNLYVADNKATSIANRIINENLPKFVDNMNAFTKIEDCELVNHFESLNNDLKRIFNIFLQVQDIFKLHNFFNVLTQKNIDIYNTIIGGNPDKDGFKGLNVYINEYNQKQADKKKKLPKLKPLFKLILNEHNSVSWLPEKFKDDNEMLRSIENCYQDLKEHILEGNNSLKELLVNLTEYDLEHIYLTDDVQLTYIAKKLYGNYSAIKDAFEEEQRRKIQNELKNKIPQNSKESNEAYQERIETLSKTPKYEKQFEKVLKENESFSLAQINRLMKSYLEEEYKPIEIYFTTIGEEINKNEEEPNLIIKIEKAHLEANTLLKTAYHNQKNLSQDKESIRKIKNLLDAIKDLQKFVKPLLGKGNESEKDNRFYGEFIPLWETLDKITPLYNMVRNRMTKKKYSDEKIKLYFENNGLFLNGWVDSKTESDNATQYGGYLFRKKNSINEYDYYLGISADAKLFRSFNSTKEIDKSSYERLDYYQLKEKTFYSALYKGNYKEESVKIIDSIENIVERRGQKSLKEKIKTEKEKKHSKISTALGYLKFIEQQDSELYKILIKDNKFRRCNQAIISSMKETLLSLSRIPSATKYAQKNYVLFSTMIEDVNMLLQQKIFSYFPISKRELNEAINRTTKALYLFKITNKDLSYAETHEKGLRKTRGMENLHTIYFKMLMSGNQNVFDIGSGSIFFREHKIKYTEEQLKKGHHYDILKDKFKYPIISKRRYAFDKFQFHLSVTLNYNAEKNKDINSLVNTYLKESKEPHIIGIDRGERNLLYYSLIDLKGNIIKQMTLNDIINEYKGVTYKTNYHDLLEKRENERTEARHSWDTIESIKELKEGYLSQVIHIIAKMMVEYNAIVVLEDLNRVFMRGRQKVEKQVYQKFEKMLIDKLNYLVDKKRDANEIGGVLNAYQLTNKFESFQKIDKQNGFLFYIPAWNTSKIDPITGFVNLFNTRYESLKKSKVFWSKFDIIRYNKEKDWFEFVFDYNNFTTKAEGTRTKWTLCTHGTRIQTFRNPEKNSQWDNKEINLTESFKALFGKYEIDINGNLKESIMQETEKKFFQELHNLLHLTLQMRNSITGTDIDYLISPVADENGNFYDSRIKGKNFPENADANGAYNIARKGLMLIRQIKQSDPKKKFKFETITNKDWLKFAQDKPYLKD